MGAGLNRIKRRKAVAEEVAGSPIPYVKFAARGGADGDNDSRIGAEGEAGECREGQGCFHFHVLSSSGLY